MARRYVGSALGLAPRVTLPGLRGALVIRLLLLLLALLGLTAWPVPVQARPDDRLAPCMRQVLRQARRVGARPLQQPLPLFLMAADARHVELRAPTDACVGVLAVGRRQVQDLRLRLYDSVGRVLSQADPADAYAYARTCVAAGEPLVAGVDLQEGAGEVWLLPFLNAPAQAAELLAPLADCAGVGLPTPAAVDVGPEPLGATLALRMQLQVARLARRGYAPLGEPEVGVVGRMARNLRRLPLPGAGCYLLAVVPDDDAADLDVRLFAGQHLALLDRDPLARGRPAQVRVCPDTAGVHIMDIRAYGRGGNYLLQAFALQQPIAGAVPGALAGLARAAFWETLYRLGLHGMVLQDAFWVHLQGGAGHRSPLRLQGGRCYGIGVVHDSAQPSQSADIVLTDALGNVVAHAQGGELAPLVFVCPAEEGLFAAHVYPGVHQPQARALLVVAGEGPPLTDRPGDDAFHSGPPDKGLLREGP